MLGEIRKGLFHAVEDKAPPLLALPRGPSVRMGAESRWEWQKNAALLEMERRNQKLCHQLTQAAVEALDLERQLCKEKDCVAAALERERAREALVGRARAMHARMIERATLSVEGRLLRAACNAWRCLVRQRKALAKSQVVWRRWELRKWLALWSAGVCERKRQHHAWRLAVKMHAAAFQRKAFQCWKLFLADARPPLRHKCMAAGHRQRILLSIAFSQLRSHAARRALCRLAHVRAQRALLSRSWITLRRTAAHAKVAARAADAAWGEAVMKQSVSAWRTWVQERTARRAVLDQVTLRHETCLCRKVLRLWARHLLVMERMRRLASRLAQHQLECAFEGWRVLWLRQKHVRLLVWRATERRQLHMLQRAWDQIIRHLLLEKRVREMATRRGLRIRKLYLEHWAKISHAKRVVATAVLRHQKYMQHKRSWACLHAWQLFCVESRQQRSNEVVEYMRSLVANLEARASRADEATAAAGRWISAFERERRALVEAAESATLRTPVWVGGGMLGTSLRWRMCPTAGIDAPFPCAGHSATAVLLCSSSHVIVFGGYNGDSYFNTVHVFSPEGCRWHIPTASVAEAHSFPAPRRDHCACTLGEHQMVIFGGFNGRCEMDDLHVLSFSADGGSCTWSQPEVRMGASPEPVSQHSGCLSADGRHLIIFGGYRSGRGVVNELWMLDLQWMEWTSPEVTGDPPKPRRGHSAAVVGHLLFLFGGFDGHVHLDDLYQLDLLTMHWSKVETIGEAPSPRRHQCMLAVGAQQLLLYGGYNGTAYLGDIFTLDTSLLFWKQWQASESRADSTPTVSSLPWTLSHLASGPGLGDMAQSQAGDATVGGVASSSPLPGGDANLNPVTTGEWMEVGETGSTKGWKDGSGTSCRVGQTGGLWTGGVVQVRERSMAAAVWDGARVVIVGGAHARGALSDVVFLENAAAEEGRALHRRYMEEMERSHKQRAHIVALEEEAANRAAELASLHLSTERLHVSIKTEGNRRREAAAAQRVVLRKLHHSRSAANSLQTALIQAEGRIAELMSAVTSAEERANAAEEAAAELRQSSALGLSQAAEGYTTEILSLQEALELAGRESQKQAQEARENAEKWRNATERAREDRIARERAEGQCASLRAQLEERLHELQQHVMRTHESEERLAADFENRLQHLQRIAQSDSETARRQLAITTAEARALALQERQQEAALLRTEVHDAEDRLQRMAEERLTWHHERDAAIRRAHEAEALRQEALEYARTMESRCREELARIEERIQVSEAERWRLEAKVAALEAEGRRVVEDNDDMVSPRFGAYDTIVLHGDLQLHPSFVGVSANPAQV